jgi:hypothetical protein
VTTREALESITDASLFERIAAAVLREAEPKSYGAISETGTNASGKTVRSPVDGIAFVTTQSCRTMVLVAHASGALEKLDGKWFKESPDTSTNRSLAKERKRPRAENKIDKGDLVKAREIIERERVINPDLAVTIALTTNREPSIDLRSKVEQFAVKHNVAIDVWAGSRIASVLDQSPNGQWIRKTLLGIEADRVSLLLLHALGKRSVRDLPSYRADTQTIDREFDDILGNASGSGLLFVVGESGCGKSVACQKLLARHVDSDGLAVVLRDQQVLDAVAVEDAIDAELRRLHPAIEKNAGRQTLAMTTATNPLLLLVEDVNRSRQPGRLIDKLIAWAGKPSASDGETRRSWQIVCPLWSQTIALSSDTSQKYIEQHAVYASTFTRNEATQALIANASAGGHLVSEIEASKVAEALGDDPLLIDLFEWNANSDPHSVVADYVNRSVNRLAAKKPLTTANEYSTSLNDLGKFLLSRRLPQAPWLDFRNALSNNAPSLSQIRELLNDKRVIQLTANTNGTEAIVFRHDQIEFYLLASSIVELHTKSQLDNQLLRDPYYARVFGQALLINPADEVFLRKVSELNPLALFHAIRRFGVPYSMPQRAIVEMAKAWLKNPDGQSRKNRRLRYAILEQLRHIRSPIAIEILRLIPDPSWAKNEIRFLNGDVEAGMRICASSNAGTIHPRRDSLVAHAKQHYSTALIGTVDDALRKTTSDKQHKAGAIRFAGFIASTGLLAALKTAWETETEKQEFLSDYLFAAAHCSGEDQELLTSLCDFWETLSDTALDNTHLSERDAVLADDLQHASRRGLPKTAIEFFISRSRTSTLKQQIHVLLAGVDHELAVVSSVQWLAEKKQEAAEQGKSPIWLFRLKDNWLGGLGQKRRMSSQSKVALKSIWSTEENDQFVRREAFSLWTTSFRQEDLPQIRVVAKDAALSDEVLRARLELRDETALDEFAEKLREPENVYWWQHVRGFQHPRLVAELDRQLGARRASTSGLAQTLDSDWILGEMVTRLDQLSAMQLLKKHWDHIGVSPYFVHAALFFAAPETLSLAAESIDKSSNPRELLLHLHMNFGVKIQGHPGVKHVEQLKGLIPYLDLLDDSCIYMFWELCNGQRWFEFRRTHLDSRLSGQWLDSAGIHSFQIEKKLDSLTEKTNFNWVYHWAEMQLEQHDSARELLLKVVNWCKKRSTLDSLEIAARVFSETATREDLYLLDQLQIDPAPEAREIVEDTTFSVFMRSLV